MGEANQANRTLRSGSQMPGGCTSKAWMKIEFVVAGIPRIEPLASLQTRNSAVYRYRLYIRNSGARPGPGQKCRGPRAGCSVLPCAPSFRDFEISGGCSE